MGGHVQAGHSVSLTPLLPWGQSHPVPLQSQPHTCGPSPSPPCDPAVPPTLSSGHAARAPSSVCPVLHCGRCQALALCQVLTLCTQCWALTWASPRGCHLSDASRACRLFPVPTNRRRVLNGLAWHQTASWCASDGMGPQSAQYTRLPQAPPSFPRFPRLLQVPHKPPPRFPRLPSHRQVPQAPALGSVYPAPLPFLPTEPSWCLAQSPAQAGAHRG